MCQKFSLLTLYLNVVCISSGYIDNQVYICIYEHTEFLISKEIGEMVREIAVLAFSGDEPKFCSNQRMGDYREV